MKRTIFASAQRASDSLRTTRPTFFICASCRRAAAIPPSQRPPPLQQTHRTLTTTSRTGRPDNSTRQTNREAIAPQTHYDFFPQTFPNGQPPKSPFSPDLKQLRKEFLQLQAKAHPDLAPADQKTRAEALSSRINEAYKTLQDPLRRAQYLLSLRGIDVEDESAKLDGLDNELLMQVMEAREAVEEVDDEAALGELRAENDGRMAASVEVLDVEIGKGAWEAAAQEAVKLRYWVNIEESIKGWEKGKGGGAIHH
nr:j-type co-chaperone jac1, mitochondrial [Quercus suber]